MKTLIYSLCGEKLQLQQQDFQWNKETSYCPGDDQVAGICSYSLNIGWIFIRSWENRRIQIHDAFKRFAAHTHTHTDVDLVSYLRGWFCIGVTAGWVDCSPPDSQRAPWRSSRRTGTGSAVPWCWCRQPPSGWPKRLAGVAGPRIGSGTLRRTGARCCCSVDFEIIT